MSEPLRCVSPESLIIGWDFSTGAVKALAFDLQGEVIAEVRMPTISGPRAASGVEPDAVGRTGQRPGHRSRFAQARPATPLACVQAFRQRITPPDESMHAHNQVRRAICWNDQTLATYHNKGLARLGGPEKVESLIGGPWAIRYSLSHLVKDEETLPELSWKKTGAFCRTAHWRQGI